eukprot:TRINITY_DN38448_c0_g1_i1.p1 TRINITY_DN38448_c0_g1~~TRINITY_DN38448_c0_g1_i1.p1  ORF type:complete len:149 (-),score=13.66 TRINITY_DN38448_c0_g1_i1:25-471(-)
MVLTSALATANAASPSVEVELVAGYMGGVVVGISMVLGVIDMGVLLMTYMPLVRNSLSLRPRDMQSAINRAVEYDSDSNDNDALNIPLLEVVAPTPTPRHTQSCLLYTSDAADEEDSGDLGGRRITKKQNVKHMTWSYEYCTQEKRLT